MGASVIGGRPLHSRLARLPLRIFELVAARGHWFEDQLVLHTSAAALPCPIGSAAAQHWSLGRRA